MSESILWSSDIRIARPSAFCLAVCLVVLFPGPVSPLFAAELSSEDAREANCGDIQKDEDRLACYEQLLECEGRTKESARLACFDGAYHRWVDVRGSEPQLAAEVRRGKPEPVADLDTFGAKPPRKKIIMSASVTAVQADGHRIDYLTLDNGQIWRETTDSHVRFRVGQAVTIESGMLGSHSMHVDGIRRMVKVKRVK